MGAYSKISDERLSTVHKDLQTVFRVVVKRFDNSIIYGHRSKPLQFELFHKGRENMNGIWVIVGETVTNCDGFNVMSDHNYLPSKAVDAIPYPEGYSSEKKIIALATYVLGVADTLYDNGFIDHRIGCGIDWDGDWDFTDQKLHDAGHFFIID